ncbi:MAG: NADH-quinone oxidoreductase subunit M [Planctomycetaceae bacterium]
MDPAVLLSLTIFMPTIGALFLLAFDRKAVEAMRVFTVVITAITFLLTIGVYLQWSQAEAAAGAEAAGGYRLLVAKEWIPSWNVFYRLGIDGISLPLVLLTGVVSLLAAIASWSIKEKVRGYLILFLLLETGMLGVFMALDFFLFYVFWEVMLLPMYFLIGIWGGPRREYAAIKFFLYTLAGGVLMLIAMLMFYFGSGGEFSLIRLAELAGDGKTFSSTTQITAFVLLFIGFAIKLPSFPFHTWLPDAHVEAPTPISMILAGVLLKMGGYGIIRVAMPLCPYGTQYAAYALVALGTFSIIYGALAAMAQTDFKRLVAYSSVSHMGYVLIGLAVWKLAEVTGNYDPNYYWQMGINGAMFQMIAHGISSTGMFFMVGVIYDRVHHRDLNQFGGLMKLMPLYGGLAIGIFFAGLGLPGLCGFIGEIFVVLSMWNYDPLLAIIAASGVILTAGYILWAIQRVYLGPEYKGPHGEDITPMNGREATVGFILLALAIILGVFPGIIFDMMTPTVEHLTETMQAGYAAVQPAVEQAQASLR